MFIVQSNGFHDIFLKMYHVHYYVRISSLFMDIESSIVFAYHISFISSHIGRHQGLKLAIRTCALPITAEQACLSAVCAPEGSEAGAYASSFHHLKGRPLQDAL